MHRTPSFAFAVALLLLAGCDDSTPSGTDAGPVCQDCDRDAAMPPMDAGADAGPGSSDAGGDAATGADAGSDAAVPSSDAAIGDVCSFNRECAADARCECDEVTGCMCAAGARGTGRVGDTCTGGNDCASAVCVEGPDSGFYCSEECATDADCGGALPRCLDITFVGRICVRVPPDGGA